MGRNARCSPVEGRRPIAVGARLRRLHRSQGDHRKPAGPPQRLSIKIHAPNSSAREVLLLIGLDARYVIDGDVAGLGQHRSDPHSKPAPPGTYSRSKFTAPSVSAGQPPL